MTGKVIEVVRFRINEGISEAAFAKSAETVNAFLQDCPGFIARRLSRGEDGEWIDHVEWQTMEAAKTASDALMQRTDLGDFLSAIDESSVVMRHNMLHSTLG
ncbi:MAG: hypothetical protein AAFW76_08245 [Pseudomonadota bacterium]